MPKWNVNKILQKRMTSEYLSSNNIVLDTGEIGYDIDNNIVKIGDKNSNQWSDIEPLNVTKNIVTNTATSTSSSSSSSGVYINQRCGNEFLPRTSIHLIPNDKLIISSDDNNNVTISSSWRGIQDNLTSTSQVDSLSANMGRTLATTKQDVLSDSAVSGNIKKICGKSILGRGNVTLNATDVGAKDNSISTYRHFVTYSDEVNGIYFSIEIFNWSETPITLSNIKNNIRINARYMATGRVRVNIGVYDIRYCKISQTQSGYLQFDLYGYLEKTQIVPTKKSFTTNELNDTLFEDVNIIKIL